VGVYETYNGRTVVILDDRHRACGDAAHQVNAVLDVDVPEMRAESASTGGATTA
jgi:hypothetical protein